MTAGEVTSTLRPTIDAAPANEIEGVVNAVFRGISQLFFANSLLAGIIIIAGIAVCSRIAAVFALIGSAVGMLTGFVLGADGVAIYNGLWGFNSFDAALAVGSAVLAALLFGAIASLFTPWGLPALTLPFCFATLAFVLFKGATSKLTAVEVADVTTPEEHLRHSRAEHSRGVGRDAVRADEEAATAAADREQGPPPRA